MAMSSTNDSAMSSPRENGALDVSFSRLSDRVGESSSQAESQKSSGKRSSGSERRETSTSEKREAIAKQEAADTSPSAQKHLSREPKSEQNGDGDSGGGIQHRVRKSGGFLLDPVFAAANGEATSRRGKQKLQNGHLSLDKRRLPASRLSADSSRIHSPLSHEVSMDHPATAEKIAPSRPLGMDAAQLVQMALDLSESRRRHVSGSGLQVSVPSSPQSRRVASGLSSGYSTISHRAPGDRASYLSEELPSSSPSSNKSWVESRGSDVGSTGISGQEEMLPHFSPATLSRAEKARKYFELASEHRRLLQHLPPLRTDVSAPGSLTISTSSAPGYVNPTVTRIPSHASHKHDLGRQYNPLQALRNRRLRARERRPLTAPLEAWLDVEGTKSWIDRVEQATTEAGYRKATDKVLLPMYAGDLQTHSEATHDLVKGHRRTSTAGTVITRPENGWTVEPTELLADAYWTEKGNHKELVENRNGNRIFPPVGRPSMERPRDSNDVVTQLAEHTARDESDIDDSHADKRSRRRNHLLPRRPKRFMRDRSASTSSSSSNDARVPPLIMRDSEGGDENIGPLERHMKEMIHKDEKGESLSSPELLTSDPWDSRISPYPMLRDDTVKARHRDTMSHAKETEHLSVEMPWHGQRHRRSKSADGRVIDSSTALALSSTEDLHSADEASSPVIPGFAPSIDMDLSPSGSERPSPEQRKSKLRRLPLFRSRSKERHKIDSTDFAEKRRSDFLADPRPSQESSRPSFLPQHRTTESLSGNSLRQNESNTSTSGADTSSREPGSTVGRFFKGGRLGEIVRNEGSRYRSRGQQDRQHDGPSTFDVTRTDSSEMEEEGLETHQTKVDSGTAFDEESDASPRASLDKGKTRQKYYLPNLPSFKSPSARSKGVESPMSVDSDPIGRQQKAQETIRWTTRFGQLAPPKINLPEDESKSNPEELNGHGYDPHRKSYGYLHTNSGDAARSNSIASLDAPATAWKPGKGPIARMSRSEGHRHWSISDPQTLARRVSNGAKDPSSNKVAPHDIARTRALLLSSGIKAREIQHQANTPRHVVLPSMQQISFLVNRPLTPIPRKQEHMHAANLLTTVLATTTRDLSTAVENFQSTTTAPLSSHLACLQSKASEHLTKLVNETSDGADAFTVELTTKQPQDIKRLDDAIDDLLRRRRRQFRWARRTGFKILEWVVLGIMWWIWFVVWVFNLGRKAAVGVGRVVRWLVTF